MLTSPTIVARTPKRKMQVATCTSANGKPPSVIKWETNLKGEANFQETRNPNGTVTVRSSYLVVPSRETHRQKLTCVVTYRSERFTDSVILNVQCKIFLAVKLGFKPFIDHFVIFKQQMDNIFLTYIYVFFFIPQSLKQHTNY